MNTTSFVNEGFDGYSEFTEGYNFEIPQAGLGQTNTIIYAPELEAGSIPYFDNANLLRYSNYAINKSSYIVYIFEMVYILNIN